MAEPQIKDQRGWSAVDHGYLDNPKMLDVLDASSVAVLVHLASFLYCAQHLTDGHLAPGIARRKAGGTAEDERLLIDAGLWHVEGHDCPDCPQPEPRKVYVHNFTQHNRTAAKAKRRSEAAKSNAEARWARERAEAEAAGNANGNATGMQTALQTAMPTDEIRNAEREKESKREGGGSRRSPSHPLPESWTPSDSHREKCSTERIDLDHEADKFRNNALAKDMRYANWDRAFTNWLSRDWVKRTSAGMDPMKDW